MSNILNDLCDNLAEKSQHKAADMAADVAVKAAGAVISGVNNQLNEWSGKDLYEICQFHAIGAATAETIDKKAIHKEAKEAYKSEKKK